MTYCLGNSQRTLKLILKSSAMTYFKIDFNYIPTNKIHRHTHIANLYRILRYQNNDVDKLNRGNSSS